jgi:hypothetical protein
LNVDNACAITTIDGVFRPTWDNVPGFIHRQPGVACGIAGLDEEAAPARQARILAVARH